MVLSINQIIVNQSVVFGCDWIDWKAPNILELTLTGFQDSSHGGFTLFTLPDTVPWDGPSKGNIIESEGFIAIQTHVCPRCWHSLCFSPCFGQFSMCFWWPEKPSASIGHCSSGRKAIRGPIPWHSQCRRGRRSWQQKLPMLKQPHCMVPVICDLIPSILHGGCTGRFTISGGMGLMNGVWSQIMPVLGYPSLDLYPAVAEKTPTST